LHLDENIIPNGLNSGRYFGGLELHAVAVTDFSMHLAGQGVRLRMGHPSYPRGRTQKQPGKQHSLFHEHPLSIRKAKRA
jgi:hypothetical protein